MTIIPSFILGFLVAAAVSFLLTPLVIRLAGRVGALDVPDARKVHLRPIPRLGGVAIFIAFCCALAFRVIEDPASSALLAENTFRAALMGVAFLIVLALGIWDDVHPLKAGPKFLVQLVVATLAYWAGFRFSSLPHPFGEGMIALGILDYPVTVLWIVGVTNALNLIDGLDGLASGVALIASLTVFAISYHAGEHTTALLALMLAGAILGFLRYNFHPARIFLGDSGSLVIGFALAILSVRSSGRGSTAFPLWVSVLALGVPLLDTFLSMLRRVLRPFLPKQTPTRSAADVLKSIFIPDRSHIHHQLMTGGYSHPKVVLVLYLTSTLLGIAAFTISISDRVTASFILAVVFLCTLYGVRQLRYREIAVHRNGILLELWHEFYEWPPLQRSLFQSLVDISFIAVAFCGARYLANGLLNGRQGPQPLLFTLLLVTAVQLGVFWLTGLYRETTRQLGVGDGLRAFRAVVAAVLATGAALLTDTSLYKVVLLLLDFFFLLSLVAVSRFSYSILRQLLHRDASGKKRVLVYGANRAGIVTLDLILDSEALGLAPLGFLDEDPTLHGKTLNGYPVYGGHWQLAFLIRKLRVDEIILSGSPLSEEAHRRLTHIAYQQKIPLRRLEIRTEDLSTEPMAQTTPASRFTSRTDLT